MGQVLPYRSSRACACAQTPDMWVFVPSVPVAGEGRNAMTAGNIIAVNFRPQNRRAWNWEPAPTGDPFLDELLSFTWATGRKVGLDDDPAVHAYEMQQRIDLLRGVNGLAPTLSESAVHP
jgi:hypothetical protein